MKSVQHIESFVVRSYDVDETGAVSLPNIADYFQEAAGKNAHDLEFDISHLQEKGATWVLFRLHIRIEEFPVRWQPVSVNTWPSSGDGVRAFRDYELIDESGKQLGTGVSQWMILNMKNRRPMRMPQEIIDMGLGVDHHLLPVDKEPFIKMENCDHKSTHLTGCYDLDMNNHVNNVKYIEWMTGYLPDDMAGGMKCHEIKIQYHRETSLGRHVIIQSQKLNDRSFLHNIHDDSDNLLAEGISYWR